MDLRLIFLLGSRLNIVYIMFTSQSKIKSDVFDWVGGVGRRFRTGNADCVAFRPDDVGPFS